MWTWRDKDGVVREFHPYDDKRCPLCGQYFKANEKACIIVPPMEVRNVNKKLSQNLMVHRSEWVEFCDGVDSDAALSEKFAKHKKPKVSPFTEKEQLFLDAFVGACRSYGFLKCFEKPYGKKCQKSGSSVYLEYNVFSDKISIDYRGKRGLFGVFYERQIVANIYNKMHSIIGDDKKDDYSAQKSIDNIVQEVNDIMGKIV